MSIVSDYFSFQNGYAFKSKDFVRNGKYAIIRIKELKDGGVKFFEDTARTNPEDSFNINKYIVKKGDVLFALTGDPVNKTNPLSWVGRVSYYNHDTPALLNQRVCKAIPKNKVSNEFLYYFFRQNEEFYNLASKATGSASQANISTKTIEQHIMEIPDEDIRKKIVFMLLNIDMKIDVNNRINDNLQQQAQAIYVSMFVSNVSSDWQQGHLSDLITVKYGKDHKKLADGNYPVYGSGGIMRYVERPLYDKESVLIPRKGTLNNVMYVNQPFWSVDTMFYTEMRMPNIAKFIYHFVKNKNLASMNAGSAVPSMTTDILNAMEIAIPSTSEFEEFETIVSPMYHAMQENNIQSAKLAELRDSLLPKFMSGEIDVSAIRL